MTTHPFRSILITGASSGIGRAVAETLACPDIEMTLTGRDRARLDAVASACRERGARVTATAQDIRDSAAMTALIAAAHGRRPLDLVLANAGISGGAGADPADYDRVRDIFDINVSGVINTVLPAVDDMPPGGRIAIVSSVAGFRGLPTAPAYSASKVAVRAWGEAIRPMLAARGIGLTLIYPGFVESRITAQNDFSMPLLMPADKAAKIIVRNLARGKRNIAFPWPTVWVMRLMSWLPGPVFDRLMARAPRKR